MADPLLTSLCTICHIEPPKYTCPRCKAKTCSLPCARKHKAWNSCSGVRDATTYMPRKELRDPNGVAHDFNYITRMEQTLGRSEHELLERKGLLRKDELRPATVKEVKWTTGRDGRKRKVVVTRLLKDNSRPGWPRGLEKRLGELGVRILHAPLGLQRQKDNKTNYNRFQGYVNWTIEFLELQDDGEVKETTIGRTRDDIPIYRTYFDWLDNLKVKETDGKRWGAKKGARFYAQIPASQTWNTAPEMVQEPGTGCWGLSASLEETGYWPSELDQQKRDTFDYFLAHPRQRADQPKKVTRLDHDDTLRETLRDTNVLEYPTLYMLRKGATLPPGFVLSQKDYVTPQGAKRAVPSEKKSQPSKRRKVKDLEEGEVMSDSFDTANDDKSSVAGSTGTSAKDEDPAPVGALEVGDVVEEESFDEDEDGHVSDWTSDTSSEGSSSEGEEGEIVDKD